MSNTLQGGAISATTDGVNVALLTDTAYALPVARAAQKLATGSGTITLAGNISAEPTAGVYTINGTAITVPTATETTDDTNNKVGAALVVAINAGVTGVTASYASDVVTIAGAYSIVESTAVAATGLTSSTEAVTAFTKVIWSDESDPSHTTLTSDWLNGYLLDVDTNGITRTRSS